MYGRQWLSGLNEDAVLLVGQVVAVLGIVIPRWEHLAW